MILLPLAARRNLAKWRLMSFVTFGLMLTIGLFVTIPLFSAGALDRLMRHELTASDTTLPLSSLLLEHRVSFAVPTTPAQLAQVDTFVRQQAPNLIGLPLLNMTRYGSTRVTRILPSEQWDLPEDLRSYQSAGLAYLTGLEEHVEIVVGDGFSTDGSQSHAIEALVSERFFYENDIQIGDRLLYGAGDPRFTTPVEVMVRGVWRPVDGDSSFWFETPDFFAFYFILPEQTFWAQVAQIIPEQLRLFAWYLYFDQEAIHVHNVERILTAVTQIQARTVGILSQVKLSMPAQELLQTYSDRAETLRTFLFLLSTPALMSLLVYLLISFNIVVASEEGEIATLKSRGAGNRQIVALYLWELLVLAALGLGAGIFLSIGLSQAMGQVYRFLTFAARPLLVLSFSTQVGIYAVVAVLCTSAAVLVPATRASRHTVLTQQQRAGRDEDSSRTAMRFYFPFELAFLIGTLYLWWRLHQQSIETDLFTGGVFVDPLYLLAPALFMAALSLVTLRGVPVVVGWCIQAIRGSLSISFWLAATQIVRRHGSYRLLLFLLIFTVALGFFSATLAGALDTYFTDIVRYDVGADLVVDVQWEQVAGQPGRWRYPPFDVVTSVPGVEAATRVWRSPGFIDGLTGSIDATLLGIDRASYVSAGWWRADLATEPLGALLNNLALNSAGVLVSRTYAQRSGLRPGDDLFLAVEGEGRPIRFVIVGLLDYFPTVDPAQGPFFVANLEHIQRMTGSQPYQIWLRLAAGTEAASVLDTLRQRGFIIAAATDSRWEAAVWRTAPQRTAFFGMLSLGFIVAIIVSGLAFLLHSLFGLRLRLHQFGWLRAIGLSRREVTVAIVLEKLFLVLLGIVIGTLIGFLAARLFIPLLQIGAGLEETTLPLISTPAWDQMVKVYVSFGVMVCVTLIILAWQLVGMRIHEAIKVGGFV